MLSQPQTRTPVNSCEYFYLITSCEEFNQNLEEHSWSYGISLRSTDLSKILADVTHVLTSVIGKCVAIDVYLSSQGTTNSTQYSLFYNCFFTNGENGSLPIENSFLSPQFISALCWIIVGDFHVTTSVILDQKILFIFYPKNPSQRWLFSFECALWRSLLVHQTQHN